MLLFLSGWWGLAWELLRSPMPLRSAEATPFLSMPLPLPLPLFLVWVAMALRRQPASAGVVAGCDAEIADRAVVGVSTWREIGPVLVVQAVPLVDHV
jgi:hypothetical protein